MAKSAGKVRAARLTDLAALGELSRLAQADGDGTRSLGLPVSGPPIGVFSLFRLPLGAFTPHDVMYVYDRGGHVAGLLRVERESSRDEWTVVELDAVGDLDAGDVRFRLVQHLLRDGAKRGAVRFHVACADADDNVELFMQAGFVRFGDEQRAVPRRRDSPLPEPMDDGDRGRVRHPPGDAAGRGRPVAAVRVGDPAARPAARVGPPPRLGAPGPRLAGPAQLARADPPVRRRRRLRPAGAGRRPRRHPARRVRPGRRRQGGPAALPQGARPSRDRRRSRCSATGWA